MAQPSSLHRTRQPFNLVIGWIGVVMGLILFGGTLTEARSGAMPFVGLAMACTSYCVLARPWIGVDAHDVVVSNVLREVTLPWEGISHTRSRGSLTILDNEGVKTTVWAIGSQKARARTGDVDSEERPGLISLWRPNPGDMTAPKASAAAIREAIDAEVIDNPPGPSGRQVRWLPIPCLLMTVAAVAIVLGFVL